MDSFTRVYTLSSQQTKLIHEAPDVIIRENEKHVIEPDVFDLLPSVKKLAELYSPSLKNEIFFSDALRNKVFYMHVLIFKDFFYL